MWERPSPRLLPKAVVGAIVPIQETFVLRGFDAVAGELRAELPSQTGNK
jgi:hypothetical protein